ncbi:MAG: hypothetical protein WAN81_09985, partial [Candidatus Binataceae bacterium]
MKASAIAQSFGSVSVWIFNNPYVPVAVLTKLLRNRFGGIATIASNYPQVAILIFAVNLKLTLHHRRRPRFGSVQE